MRRLVVEVDVAEFARVSGDQSIGKIKSLEVLNFLKEDPDEFVTICRVELKSPTPTFEDLFGEAGSDVQVLDHEGRRYIALFKGKPNQDPYVREFLGAGGYISTPLEIKDGMARLTFVGTSEAVKGLLGMLKSSGVRATVVHVSDAGQSRDSPLSCLTEKQRAVIVSAFRLGYYDVPRRINTQELARRLKIRGSTMAMHRIKAERRLLSELLKGA